MYKETKKILIGYLFKLLLSNTVHVLLRIILKENMRISTHTEEETLTKGTASQKTI